MVQMTDVELELAILRRYVEHHDAIGMEANKCTREMDMRDVISDIIGRPVDDVVVKRWHARLAPPTPYPAGILRSCSDSTINNGSHRFHARAYFDTGKAPAWERIVELESKLPVQPSIKKEKEQKFGILNSLGQAATDFTLYTTGIYSDGCVGILFLDIDNFKTHNTRFTEFVVDHDILIPFQQLLSNACLYRGDAYRHGGEEFLVLLPNQTIEEVTKFAERLRLRIESQEFSVGDRSARITVSIGIALWPKHGVTLDELIKKANRAEHLAKDKGKNQIVVHDE
jgi:diguanylate cyclase (GGDEF)-like protein